MVEGALVATLDIHWPEKGTIDEEGLEEIATAVQDIYGVAFDPTQPPFADGDGLAKDRDELGRAILEVLNQHRMAKVERWNEIASRNEEMGFPTFDRVEREISIGVLDQQWKDHLHSMDGLREGIGLRGYAQVDPKREYTREGFAMFGEMEERVDQHIVNRLFHIEARDPQAEEAAAPAPKVVSRHPAMAEEPPEARGGSAAGAGPVARPAGAAGVAAGKVGRNDPCPCGSGKKFKKCCAA
jgi:preprotein translocase subunit SecA